MYFGGNSQKNNGSKLGNKRLIPSVCVWGGGNWKIRKAETENGNEFIKGASLVPRANSALMSYTEGIGTALVRQWEANDGKL